ncbi:hypothetical protein D3C80_1214350 [compost metagenome]
MISLKLSEEETKRLRAYLKTKNFSTWCWSTHSEYGHKRLPVTIRLQFLGPKSRPKCIGFAVASKCIAYKGLTCYQQEGLLATQQPTLAEIMSYIDERLDHAENTVSRAEEFCANLKTACADLGVRTKMQYNHLAGKWTFTLQGKLLMTAALTRQFTAGVKFTVQTPGGEVSDLCMDHGQALETLRNLNFDNNVKTVRVYESRILSTGGWENFIPFMFKYGVRSMRKIQGKANLTSDDSYLNKLLQDEQRSFTYTMINLRSNVTDADRWKLEGALQ